MASDYSYHRLLPFDLEKGVKGKGTRIQVQLTDKFREAIVEMRIMPGQLLPSTRELARLFSISRATAVRVYKDLTAQGFIETIEGKGTFVRRRLVEMKEQNLHLQPIPLSDYGRHVMTMQAEKLTAHDFPELNYGCSPPEFLPLVLWRQALLQGSKGLESGDIEYGAEPFGNLGLRRALSGLLARARSIECPVENLVVCASSTYLISLLCELLVEPGQAVAFPEPGPLYARDIFSAGGCDLLPVTVDEDGPVVEEVTRLSRLPSLLYINSAHADPTGATTSLERRKALLSWAQANKVIIIEDDYDAEFRYGSTNLPPLKALCHDDSVIYLGNFWRSLYPLVNLGYAIIPQALVPVLTQCWHLRQNTFHTHLPFVDQLALTALIDSGDYEKHLLRNHAVFSSRWRFALLQLSSVLGGYVSVEKESSTYQLFLRFHTTLSDEVILDCARQAGLPLLGAQPYYLMQAPTGAFIMPFAHVAERDLQAILQRFKEEMEKCSF